MNIAVCILFYEKPQQTIECVRSFVSSGVPIYVLNNGSSSSARKRIENFCARYSQVKVFKSSSNVGISGGRNYLIENTREDWLFFVDNDIVVNTTDWASRFASHVALHPATEALVPRLLNLHENEYVTYTNIVVEDNVALLVQAEKTLINNFPGGAALIRRELFSRLGQYDERLFVGGEDLELALRGVLSNAPIISWRVEEVELVHDHRQVHSFSDVKAVRQRYDIDRIDNSFGIIKNKHGVIVQDNWKKWVEVQLSDQIRQNLIVGVLGNMFCRESGTPSIQDELFTIPTSCTLFMTDRCNLACRGCRRSLFEPGEAGDMSLAIVKQTVLRYPRLNEFCVAGFGEPTLCREFAEVIDFIKSRNAYVGIISNGLELSPFLNLKSAPDSITISLYGYDAKSYESYCGRALFEQVLKTYAHLRSVFPAVGFSIIVGKHNYSILSKMLTLCDQLNPSFVDLVNHLPYLDEGDGNVISSSDLNILEFIKQTCQNRTYIRSLPTALDLSCAGGKCLSFERLMNVDASGNIGGCQRQTPPDLSYGNIFDDKDPFNSTRMRAQRFKMRRNIPAVGQCLHCFGF